MKDWISIPKTNGYESLHITVMGPQNKWVEVQIRLQSRSREKIVWFPKIYYQMEKGLLHIRCEITLGKYQDQLLRLEDKLESGLYCELTDKTLHDGYIEYTLLYDMIANRITIDEVKAENGCLRLMKNLVWEYDALPHAPVSYTHLSQDCHFQSMDSRQVVSDLLLYNLNLQ